MKIAGERDQAWDPILMKDGKLSSKYDKYFAMIGKLR